MSLTLKKILVTILTAFMLFSATMFMTSVVKADDANADMTFEMVAGASLRLDTERNGIRYQAKVGAGLEEKVKGTQDAYFGMLVIPESYLGYVSSYDNIVEGLFETVPTNNLWNIEGMEVYNGYLKGVVSNIIYENFNVQRLAIAYYFDGTDYHYPTNYMDTLRSVGEVVDSALADFDTYMRAPYNADSRKVLYEFDYLADSQNAGVAEETARAGVVDYVNNCANKEKAIFNEEDLIDFSATVDFSDNISSSLSIDNSTWQGAAKLTTLSVEDSSLKVTLPKSNANGYAGFTISLDKTIEVKLRTAITLHIESDTEQTINWRIFLNGTDKGYKSRTLNAGLNELTFDLVSDYKFDIGSELTELEIGLTKFVNESTFSIKKITYSYILAENELINFNGGIDYSAKYGTANTANATINGYADGVAEVVSFNGGEMLKVTANEGEYAKLKISFDRSVTVFENTKVQLHFFVEENVSFHFYIYDGTNTNGTRVHFFSKAFNAGQDNIITITPTAAGKDNINSANYTAGFGYSVGAILDSIQIVYKNTLYLDKVTFLGPVLAENELVNFDGVDYESTVSTPDTHPNSTINAYRGNSKYSIVNNEYTNNSSLKIGFNDETKTYGAVLITFDRKIVVTSTTKLTFHIWVDSSYPSYSWLYIAGTGDNPAVKQVSYTPKAAIECAVTVNATDLGYKEGDTITAINFGYGNIKPETGEKVMYLDKITFSN